MANPIAFENTWPVFKKICSHLYLRKEVRQITLLWQLLPMLQLVE